jgi:uncharacterized pyridoxamine 5'-phosphate oxidase family protein
MISISNLKNDKDLEIIAEAYSNYYANSVLEEKWTTPSALKMFKYFYDKNPDLLFVAYDEENWIRINCQFIDDSNNIDAKKAIINEFDWAEEAGYTLDNPDFQALYIANADVTIADSDGNILSSYKF